MAKRGIICEAEAAYVIKGTSDFYCHACALDQFGDITVLVKVEDDAKRLKDLIDKSLQSGDVSSEEDEDMPH